VQVDAPFTEILKQVLGGGSFFIGTPCAFKSATGEV